VGETSVDPSVWCLKKLNWITGQMSYCLNTYLIFNNYLIINFCQSDLQGSSPLCEALFRMKLLRSPIKCLTYRILYFIQNLFYSGSHSHYWNWDWGVNSNRAQHVGLTATNRF